MRDQESDPGGSDGRPPPPEGRHWVGVRRGGPSSAGAAALLLAYAGRGGAWSLSLGPLPGMGVMYILVKGKTKRTVRVLKLW